MKLSSANLIALGQRELRAIGEKCDPACYPWYACANSKPDGVCEGFVLMNGETRKHLNRILNENDGKYVESCMSTIQRGCDAETEEALVSEVLRYLPPQPTQRKEGFLAQLEASCGVQDKPTATAEPEEETHLTTAFRSMLEESSAKGKNTDVVETQNEQRHPEPSEIIQRHIPTDFEYQLPQICNDSCFIKRHCGAYPAQVGNLCVKRSEQYANRTFIDKEAKTR